jgi:hypothetical protein
MAGSTPDGVVNAQGVGTDTKDAPDGRKSADKTLRLDVVGADSTSTELTNCVCIFFALDTFHIVCGVMPPDADRGYPKLFKDGKAMAASG